MINRSRIKMDLWIRSKELNLAIKLGTILALLVLAGFTLPHLVEFLQVQFWRHDSVYYVSSYGGKVKSEGRWLNYFAFHGLKHVPAWLSILISYGAVGCFSFHCSYRLNRDKWFSLLLALAVVNIPFFRMQLEWPTTLLPAFVLLGFAPWLSRRVPDYCFFAFYGVLLLGSFSSLYFLLPLLYMQNITVGALARTLMLWVLGFVLGYAVSQTLVWVALGHFIEVASWRQPHPVDSLSALLANLVRAWGYMRNHFLIMLSCVSVPLFTIACAWSWLGGRPWQRVILWVAAMFIFMAPYATTVPYGIVVSGRTAFISMLALLLVLFMHERINNLYRGVAVILLLSIGISMAQLTGAYTAWYKGLTDAMLARVKQSMPLPPSSVDTVYIRIDDTQWRSFTDGINESEALKSPDISSEGFDSQDYRRSLIIALGYERVVDCGVSPLKVCQEPLLPDERGIALDREVHAQVVMGNNILLTMPLSASK